MGFRAIYTEKMLKTMKTPEKEDIEMYGEKFLRECLTIWTLGIGNCSLKGKGSSLS